MATSDAEALGRRREPVQKRSKKRVERIRAAALELLNTGGEQAVTTRAIAELAGIPVATVYQFFPNRDAILQELLQDMLDRRDSEGVAILATLQPRSISEVVQAILEFHHSYLISHPQIVTLFYTSRTSGLLPDPLHRRAQMAQSLHYAMIHWNLIRPDTDPQVATVAIELGDHILELMHRAWPDGDRVMLTEGQRALTAYLQTYACE